MKSPGFTLSMLSGAVMSLALHWLFGWAWTFIGGALAGFLAQRSGILAGGCGVALEWGVVVVADFLLAREAIGRMGSTLGALFADLPALAIIALTVLIGMIIGLLGGTVGSLVKSLAGFTKTTHQPG